MGVAATLPEFSEWTLHSMRNWQGIPTIRLTLDGEVMVPRDNRTLVFSTELLNYIIPFAATQGNQAL